MTKFQIYKHDLYTIAPTAQALARYWTKQGKPSTIKPTMSGLMSEYAVIKFLNCEMGAHPEIQFRTEYDHGTDGGVDFEMMGLTWDVKSTRSEKLSKTYALKTKSRMIIGVQNLGNCIFDIWGFMPFAKVTENSKNYLERSDFCALEKLEIDYTHFHKRKIKPHKPHSDLTPIKDILAYATLGLKF